VKERLTRLVPAIQRALPSRASVVAVRRRKSPLLRAQRLESIGAMGRRDRHDLNNVLSPILMSVEVMRRRLSLDDTLTAALLDRIESSAKRGADMVKQILLSGVAARGSTRNVDCGSCWPTWSGWRKRRSPRASVSSRSRSRVAPSAATPPSCTRCC
jgi:hypothetical protein